MAVFEKLGLVDHKKKKNKSYYLQHLDPYNMQSITFSDAVQFLSTVSVFAHIIRIT
jgi:hypothetical protein